MVKKINPYSWGNNSKPIDSLEWGEGREPTLSEAMNQ